MRWFVVALAACSSSSSSPDAASEQCAVDLGAWGTPTALGLSLANGPAPSDDELELYFSATGSGLGGADLYRVSRASTDAAWGAAESLLALNTQFNESTPALSHDGLTMWFASDRGGNDDIWVTQRPDRASDWITPVVVNELSSTGIEYGPSPFLDDLDMLIAANGGFEIAQRLQPGDRWQTPVALAAPMSTGPGWISPCGLELDFASNGTFFKAKRTTSFGAFDPEQAIADLPGGDSLKLSPDRHHAYFSRDGDLYEAVR